MRRSSLVIRLGVLALALALPARAFHLEDTLKGATVGNPVGGSIGANGWTVTDRTDRLWYSIPTMSEGSIEFTVANITTTNLDLEDHEIFALYEAGFGITEPINYNPEYRDNFYKSMIRIYGTMIPDRIGMQKLMWGICNGGAPGYGPCPCASSFFAEPFGGDQTWDGSPQRLRVEWSGGHARLLRNGAVVHDVDYSGSGQTYAPSAPHFSFGSSRATAVAAAGVPVGSVFSDLVVDGSDAPAITSCTGTGTGGTGGAAGGGGTTGTDAGGPKTLTFSPVADSWSDPTAPSSTHGSDVELRVESDGRTIFLRFDVQGITGAVTSAKVVVNATNAGGGGDIHSLADITWDEATLSHQNKPTPDAGILSSVPQTTIGGVFEFDVTTALTGNGLKSFAITSTSDDGCAYASRESATPPQLIVEVSGAGGAGGTSGSGGSWSDSGISTSGTGGAKVKPGSTEAGDDGCGCRVRREPASFAGWLALFCALLFVRRSRR